MIKGPVDKFRKENALLTQAFVIDGKTPVGDVIAAAAKEAGAPIALTDYVRFQLGEGIEKKTSDFAAEVAAAAGHGADRRRLRRPDRGPPERLGMRRARLH